MCGLRWQLDREGPQLVRRAAARPARGGEERRFYSMKNYRSLIHAFGVQGLQLLAENDQCRTHGDMRPPALTGDFSGAVGSAAFGAA